MRIHLRAGEKLYVNGGVLRVDRKVSIEFLNDVTFLLEHHVMQAEEATTPLRQLYFSIQTMLISPHGGSGAREFFHQSCAMLEASFRDKRILESLASIRALVHRDRPFEALKGLRALFPIEDDILARTAAGNMSLPRQQPGAEAWK